MRDKINSNEPYLIAETAYSFEGDKGYLLKQTLELSDKIDAIKYHMLFNIEEYMTKSHSAFSTVKKWILKENDWIEILQQAKNKKLDTIILTDDLESIDFCVRNHQLIDGIEIHAACVNDINMLNKAIHFSQKYDKYFLLGISGFEIQELLDITEYIKKKNVSKLLFMYGFQNFPTKIEDINLIKINLLVDILKCKIGYADHTEYSNENKELLIYSSYAMGANVQEVHYVIEEGFKRTDYITAVNNSRLEKIKHNLENIKKAMGRNDLRLNQGEKNYLNYRKVPLYKMSMKSGVIFEETSVVFKRVETPTSQHKVFETNPFYGKKLKNNVICETEFNVSDIEVEND